MNAFSFCVLVNQTTQKKQKNKQNEWKLLIFTWLNSADINILRKWELINSEFIPDFRIRLKDHVGVLLKNSKFNIHFRNVTNIKTE